MITLNYEILKLSWKFYTAVRYRTLRKFQFNQKESLTLLVTSVNKFTTYYAIRSLLPCTLLHLWQSGLTQSNPSHVMAILFLNLNVAVQVCTLKVHRVKCHMHYPFPSLYHTPRSLYPRAESDYELRHVCLSVRMEKRGSHWTDFHEIIYLIFFCLKMFPKI